MWDERIEETGYVFIILLIIIIASHLLHHQNHQEINLSLYNNNIIKIEEDADRNKY